ncbi:MAG TPA: Hpt domain-containing protein [Pirellulaceae bacterium]
MVESPRLLETLDSSISNQNADEARRARHSLKGLAAHVDAEPWVAAAARLEDFAQDRNWDACGARLPTRFLKDDRLLAHLANP